MPDLINVNSALSSNAPMSFSDWYNSTHPLPDVDPYNTVSAEDYQKFNMGYGFGGAFNNFFTGNADRARDEYNAYLMQQERLWDLAKINDARQWEEYMDSTKYQRAVKDIQNTGFNPLLALTGGSVGSTPASPSSNSAGSLRANLSKSDQLGTVVSLLGTAFKVAAMFMMSKAAGVKAAAAAAGADLAQEKWQHGGYQEHSWFDSDTGIHHKYHYR